MEVTRLTQKMVQGGIPLQQPEVRAGEVWGPLEGVLQVLEVGGEGLWVVGEKIQESDRPEGGHATAMSYCDCLVCA
ncbi:MAG: hypothetical protein AAF400_02915, partial [Bacteroidota bacterium]